MDKQTISINFQSGIDTKTDPFQVPAGKFLSLVNSVFTTTNRLTKRNGNRQLASIPEPASFITTFNDDLTAIGSSIQVLSAGTDTWISKGSLQPLKLSVLPLIRSDTNQSQIDSAVSANGLICTVYTDQNPSSVSTLRYMYAVADATTGQNIISPTVLVDADPIYGAPRVFLLGTYFLIVYTRLISAADHLSYIAVSTVNPTVVTSVADAAAAYGPATTVAWDGIVFNNSLYLAYNGASASGIKMVALNAQLTLGSTFTPDATHEATMLSVAADEQNATIWVSYYNSGTMDGYTLARDTMINPILAATLIITGIDVANITSSAQAMVNTIIYEVSNNYAYDTAIPTHYLRSITCTQAGVVGSPVTILRSVGLASKSFIVGGVIHFLTAYQSPFQPSYFLSNLDGKILSKLAYGNGGGYLLTGLPSVTVTGDLAQVGYRIKDFITSQNTSEIESITKSGIYSQTGLNLVSFTLNTSNIVSGEIAQSLHLTGGFLWQYDGYSPVEHNFFVWPDSVEGTPVNMGGAMVPQLYQYQVIYQWTDNQGNIHNSAPSIPINVDMSSANLAFTQPTPLVPTATGTAGTFTIVVSSATGLVVGQYVTDTTNPTFIQASTYITHIAGTTITLSLPLAGAVAGDSLSISSICSTTVNIPTLRLTYKTANPVKVAVFRWSVAQQSFFQVTSIQLPLMNNMAVDYVTFTDTVADNQIVGNSLIYTTGGVVENVGAPSFNSLTLFDDRLWGIDAENTNLLWYSKQVLDSTPVEMSDLFTFYVAPSTGAQGSTGSMQCLFPMDDKLIIFKKDAILYINGNGPDNTGANNQYSQPIFVTSSVGSVIQESIAMTDAGLMFQSDKGIWLFQRNGVSVVYVGYPVEQQALASLVNGANTIPKTTQSRFTLDSGETLMYDYLFQQWGTFEGVAALSSTLYQEFHTYVDQYQRIFQENPGSYLDGTNPVLMSFQTGWINLAGISGYQRIYEILLLGGYLTPNQLQISVAYDFGSPIQSDIITPTNITGVYGSDDLYGQTTPYGGPGNLLQWRVQTQVQKCQVFQITVQEIFNPEFGPMAGAGFTLSGMTCLIGVKKGSRPIRSVHTVG